MSQTNAPDKEKKGLTRDQLRDMVSSTVKDVLAEEMETALKPIREQQTDWMEKIQSAAKKKIISDDPKLKGIGAARFVRAFAFGRGDPNRAAYFADKAWDDDLGDHIKKALAAGDFTAGGFMIPPEFVPDIIDLLRNRTVVRAAGARTLPMNQGSLTLRKQTGAATASYVGESQNIDTSQPTGGQIVMTAKKLAAVVPLSNDLLMFTSGPQADEFVRDDLVQVLAIREDRAFLRDDGLQDKPKGLRHWATDVIASGGTTATDIEDDFKDLINSLEGADVPLTRPVWIMHPRSKNHLVNLRDGNGNLIYPEIRTTTPTLYGWPVFVTTSIPTTLGAGSNESEIYFVDMMQAIIAETSGLEIAVDSSASYVDGSSLVSAFTRDETLIRAISRHDFAMRYDEAVAVKNQVTWGS